MSGKSQDEPESTGQNNDKMFVARFSENKQMIAHLELNTSDQCRFITLIVMLL